MLARAVILFVSFVTVAGIVARANESEPVLLRASFDLFPMEIGQWRGTQFPPLDEITLSVLGADDYLHRAYTTPERAGVGFFVGYYESQRQGDTMHSPLNCLPGAGWEPLSKTTMAIPVASSAADTSESPIVVNRYVIQKGLERQLVIYWYQSHGRVVASEYWGKYYLVRDSIRLHRTDGALVRVIAPIDARAQNGEADAERLAVQFVKTMFPLLGGYLPV
jgi:EpsI family protein